MKIMRIWKAPCSAWATASQGQCVTLQIHLFAFSTLVIP
ncbi:hypothetical protein SLEP1_g6881 [Rubroshorea leprosula]|uniref:Uncharacterized protein n=1 Tax=Rubroshorea leprosula TaxID=152421 RepID=A0AAV5I6L4_9ROSI|nr:hypothetical protein SLEP1_g6881 [Rubroshorea leprosula]